MVLRAITLGAVALAVTGCSDYLARRDTLLLGAGEAVQTNMVAHVIDPWPPVSRRTETDTSGARLQGAVERYRAGPTNPGPVGSPPAASPPPVPVLGGSVGGLR